LVGVSFGAKGLTFGLESSFEFNWPKADGSVEEGQAARNEYIGLLFKANASKINEMFLDELLRESLVHFYQAVHAHYGPSTTGMLDFVQRSLQANLSGTHEHIPVNLTPLEIGFLSMGANLYSKGIMPFPALSIVPLVGKITLRSLQAQQSNKIQGEPPVPVEIPDD
jgi:hypothetical protein